VPAGELRRHLDADNKVLIVEVREPGKFNETIPGATNIPFDQLEGRLKSVPKDTYLVFTCGTGRTSSQAAKLAEELGFKSTTFCPVNQWKEQGYQAEPRAK
jgi:rhodanese-related sulfurtransferase